MNLAQCSKINIRFTPVNTDSYAPGAMPAYEPCYCELVTLFNQ